MPNIIACPACGKKYKLPDSFSAKRVRCQACGADFAAQYEAQQLNETTVIPPLDSTKKPAPNPQRAQQQQRRSQGQEKRRGKGQGKTPPQTRPQGKPAPGPSANELSKMGLSQIKSQPDLFTDDPSPPAGGLGNLAVDPGFGNSRSGSAANQPQTPAGPNGGLEDVVSNPFMASTGADSVDSRRKKALKRKKEDELLAAYKTSDVSLKQDRGTSDLSENGINRTSFWFAHFIFNVICKVIEKSTDALADLPSGPNAAPLSQSNQITAGFFVLFIAMAFLVGTGFFHATLTSLRFQNMRFKNPLWKKIATIAAFVPWVLFAVAMLMIVILTMTQQPVFLMIALVVGVIGVLALLPSYIAQSVAMILPPEYGVHGKLDVPAYIWIALFGLGLLLVLFAIGAVTVAVLGQL